MTSISAATNNQILDAGWSYDAAGNIIGANNAGTSVALLYDAEDRQVAYCYPYTANCVNTPGPGVTVYYYDGEGQRVEQIDPTTGTTVFVYDAFGELVADYGGSAMPSSGTEYATVDDVGTTRLVTDSQGSVLERHDFEPFGHELMGTEGGWRSSVAGYGVTPTSVRQQFTGKERDGETGLDYFGARYFSSAQGRWTSPDWSPIPRPVPYATLADPQTFNLYSYVRNNPLGRTDPDGHCPDDDDACLAAGDTLAGTPFHNLSFKALVVGVLQDLANMLPVSENPNAGPANPATTPEEAQGQQAGAIVIGLGGGAFALPEAAPAEAEAAGAAADADAAAAKPSEAYNRRAHYGDTPTAADKKAVGGESVDHDPPLVKRYYEGDAAKGEKPGHQQTPAERKASANDRTRMRPSTKDAQRRQGGQMSNYSKQQKKKNGLN